MTMPPPGEWPPQHPGQPGYPPQQPPPGWLQPTPPPRRGKSLKWLLIGVAVLLVIAVSVGATLLFTRSDGGGGAATPTSGGQSDIASAGDTGPVSIITDEPTCTKFVSISNSLSDIESSGWGDARSSLGPVAEWTDQQRTFVEQVATAMRNAADQSVALLKQTPHRVIRELYEQFIAYGRAYADSAADYVPADDGLASANVNAGSAIIGICNTITYGSASRGVAIEPAPQPSSVAPVGDPVDPKRFIERTDPTCASWVQRLDKFNADTTQWADVDPSTPASQWTPERRSLEQSVEPLIQAYATDAEALGQQRGLLHE